MRRRRLDLDLDGRFVSALSLSPSDHLFSYFYNEFFYAFTLASTKNHESPQRHLLPLRKRRESRGAGRALQTCISIVSPPLTCTSQPHPCERVQSVPLAARHATGVCPTVMGHSHPCTRRFGDSKLRRGKLSVLKERAVCPEGWMHTSGQNGRHHGTSAVAPWRTTATGRSALRGCANPRVRGGGVQARPQTRSWPRILPPAPRNILDSRERGLGVAETG